MVFDESSEIVFEFHNYQIVELVMTIACGHLILLQSDCAAKVQMFLEDNKNSKKKSPKVFFNLLK